MSELYEDAKNSDGVVESASVAASEAATATAALFAADTAACAIAERAFVSAVNVGD